MYQSCLAKKRLRLTKIWSCNLFKSYQSCLAKKRLRHSEVLAILYRNGIRAVSPRRDWDFTKNNLSCCVHVSELSRQEETETFMFELCSKIMNCIRAVSPRRDWDLLIFFNQYPNDCIRAVSPRRDWDFSCPFVLGEFAVSELSRQEETETVNLAIAAVNSVVSELSRQEETETKHVDLYWFVYIGIRAVSPRRDWDINNSWSIHSNFMYQSCLAKKRLRPSAVSMGIKWLCIRAVSPRRDWDFSF